MPSTCEAPTGDPIVHQGGISASETWQAGSMHIVEGIVQLTGGSTLTIDACVEIRMRPGAGFDVRADANSIVAKGEATAPVRIVADDPTAGWGNIRVFPTSTLRLSYTRIEDGGREADNDPMRAVIDVYGDQTQPVQPLLHVDHVEIVGAGAVGIALTENAGFSAESSALSITGSGLYPVRAWPAAVTHLPDGDYSGNARDELVIVGRPLTVDATLRDRGVRYLVGDELSASVLSVGAGQGGMATLTIEPGVELAFKAGGMLEIEHFTGEFPASGALFAVGTAAAPIVFTSAESTTAGAWVGVVFGGTPQPTSRIEHAVVEYAGGVNGTQGFNCSDIENGRDQGGILVLGLPARAFVQSTHIAHSAGFGIDRGWDGAEIDLVTGNTFENIAWCLQSAPHDSDHSCPSNPPCETE
jgi:hypothetical protein